MRQAFNSFDPSDTLCFFCENKVCSCITVKKGNETLRGDEAIKELLRRIDEATIIINRFEESLAVYNIDFHKKDVSKEEMLAWRMHCSLTAIMSALHYADCWGCA